jgi:hypothetical protein
MIGEKGRKRYGGAVLITKIDARTKGVNSNAKYYCSKRRSHHEAHYVHYSWCRDGDVPGT